MEASSPPIPRIQIRNYLALFLPLSLQIIRFVNVCVFTSNSVSWVLGAECKVQHTGLFVHPTTPWTIVTGCRLRMIYVVDICWDRCWKVRISVHGTYMRAQSYPVSYIAEIELVQFLSNRKSSRRAWKSSVLMWRGLEAFVLNVFGIDNIGRLGKSYTPSLPPPPPPGGLLSPLQGGISPFSKKKFCWF